MVKNLPNKTQVQSPGREDPWRRKWRATPALWEIAWTEKLLDYSPWGHKEPNMTERLESCS